MESSSYNCLLAELGIEDPLLMEQWPAPHPHLDYTNFHQNHHHQHVVDFKRDDNNNNNSNSLVESSLSSPRPNEEITHHNINFLSFSFSSLDQPVIRSTNRAVSTSNNRLAQDHHIVAEKKRRERLNLRFIPLSALLPGLKKMDKASVLGDAINHIKQLQHKAKALEDQSKRPKVESFVLVKKYQVRHASDHETSSSSSSSNDDPIVNTESSPVLPEIEARACDKDILVSICCRKRKGALEKTVAEIEKIHLSFVNSSVVSFGDSSLHITVVAQKDEEFNGNMEELLNNLHSALM